MNYNSSVVSSINGKTPQEINQLILNGSLTTKEIYSCFDVSITRDFLINELLLNQSDFDSLCFYISKYPFKDNDLQLIFDKAYSNLIELNLTNSFEILKKFFTNKQYRFLFNKINYNDFLSKKLDNDISDLSVVFFKNNYKFSDFSFLNNLDFFNCNRHLVIAASSSKYITNEVAEFIFSKILEFLSDGIINSSVLIKDRYKSKSIIRLSSHFEEIIQNLITNKKVSSKIIEQFFKKLCYDKELLFSHLNINIYHKLLGFCKLSDDFVFILFSFLEDKMGTNSFPFFLFNVLSLNIVDNSYLANLILSKFNLRNPNFMNISLAYYNIKKEDLFDIIGFFRHVSPEMMSTILFNKYLNVDILYEKELHSFFEESNLNYLLYLHPSCDITYFIKHSDNIFQQLKDFKLLKYNLKSEVYFNDFIKKLIYKLKYINQSSDLNITHSLSQNDLKKIDDLLLKYIKLDNRLIKYVNDLSVKKTISLLLN